MRGFWRNRRRLEVRFPGDGRICGLSAVLVAVLEVGCGSTAPASQQLHASDGPLSQNLQNLTPLATPCSFGSRTGVITIALNAYESVFISKRAVDSAVLVQGDICLDNSGTTPVTAFASKVKTITIAADTSTGADLSGSAETVAMDESSGAIALAGSTTTGVFIDLGGGGDQVRLVSGSTIDRFGCKAVAGKENIGLASASSADVKITAHAGNLFTIDLGDGNDSFDKGNCTAQIEVYGGNGNDTLLAGSDITATNDHFHGGAGIDTISYAGRASGVVVTADGLALSGDPSGGGEQDVVEADIENIIGGDGDDKLTAAAGSLTAHALTGGSGNDTMKSQPGGAVTFAGGTGVDTVDYSARSSGIVVTIGSGSGDDGASGDLDTIGSDIENIIGSSYADNITGSVASNVITPGNGNDIVNGGDGDDVFVASASATDGSDTFNGGKGSDTVDYSMRAHGVCVVLDGVSPSGDCTFALGNPAMTVSASDSDIIGADVECAIGTNANDHLIGNSSSNELIGLGGANWLEGKSGNDQLDSNTYTTGSNGCNPKWLTCIGTVSPGTCDCATAPISASCSATAVLNCGADPLDLASCQGAGDNQFLGCAITQR